MFLPPFSLLHSKALKELHFPTPFHSREIREKCEITGDFQ
jgi:hypothetical protein